MVILSFGFGNSRLTLAFRFGSDFLSIRPVIMPPKAKAKAGKQDVKGGKQEKSKPADDAKKLKAANAGSYCHDRS